MLAPLMCKAHMQGPAAPEPYTTSFGAPIAPENTSIGSSTRLSQAAELQLQGYVKATVLADLQDRIAVHHAAQQCLPPAERRPFVTLTYAQSLDGSIASADKRPVRISGKASRIMTHGLRSLHDGILVGGGTVRRDNPRLNVREWVGDSGDSQDPPPCPRPIVLSSQMGLPMAIKAHGAVIFTSFCRAETQSWLAARAQYENGASGLGGSGGDPASGGEARGGGGDASDCVILHCATAAGGCCDLRDCLARLAAMGFASVMVEGGGRIIRAFLQAGLVDRLVVTVAPLMLGGYTLPLMESFGGDGGGDGGGESGGGGSGGVLHLEDVRYMQLGDDMVVMATPTRSSSSSSDSTAQR